MFTKFLVEEGIDCKPSSFHNDRLDEFITWYDITDEGELSIGISNENGNIYLYVSEELFDYIDSSKYARVIDKNEASIYSVFFNLMKDVNKDDIDEYDSDFPEKL